MAKVKYIPCDIYKRGISIFIGSLKEFKAWVKKEYVALAHELLHATFHVLNFCHVEYSYDGNNESFTYLLEHLTRWALEKDGYENV
jgi:hypothetical protein